MMSDMPLQRVCRWRSELTGRFALLEDRATELQRKPGWAGQLTKLLDCPDQHLQLGRFDI